jgi:hypothetical protein
MARTTFTKSEIRFCTKFTTDWLPIGANMKKQGQIITACHRCNELEPTDHLFTCKNNKAGRTSYIKAIKRTLIKHDTERDIRIAITIGLKIWAELPTTSNVPERAKYCFEAQNKLGWHLAAKGLLAQQWSQAQQAYSTNQSKKPNELAGDTWNKHISSELIRQAHTLWIDRCNEVHEANGTEEKTKEEKETIAQLHRLYEKSKIFLNINKQAIFNTPIAEHIKKGTHHIKQWIRRNAKTIRTMTDNETKRHKRQMTIDAMWGTKPRMKSQGPAIRTTVEHIRANHS